MTSFPYCTFPLIERAELFRRVVFCFLTGNEDMHLKNFSVLVRDGIVKLAPGYDLLNSTIVLRQADEELALPLKGKMRNLTRNDLVHYYGGERLGLNDAVLADVLGSFARSVPAWPATIAESFLPPDLQEAYLELVAERAARIGLDAK